MTTAAAKAAKKIAAAAVKPADPWDHPKMVPLDERHTHTEVDGVAVVAVEPVYSPLHTDEVPMIFHSIVRLLLADERTLIGCMRCEYTAPAAASVRSHAANVHGSGTRHGRRPAGEVPPPAVLDMTLGAVLTMAAASLNGAGAAEKIAADRDHWKERALAAEKLVGQWRRLLGSLSDAGKADGK